MIDYESMTKQELAHRLRFVEAMTKGMAERTEEQTSSPEPYPLAYERSRGFAAAMWMAHSFVRFGNKEERSA